jgi:septation ring formation regulator EzrA
MLIQLDLFEQDENILMRKEIQKVRESNDKVRRGLFARHNELAKLWVELDHRLNIIERCICKGGD